jgi:hypothetical protein
MAIFGLDRKYAPIATGFADIPLPSLAASLHALLVRCADPLCPLGEREGLEPFVTAHLIEIAQIVMDLVEADPALLPEAELRRCLTGSDFQARPVSRNATGAGAGGGGPRVVVVRDGREEVIR